MPSIIEIPLSANLLRQKLKHSHSPQTHRIGCTVFKYPCWLSRASFLKLAGFISLSNSTNKALYPSFLGIKDVNSILEGIKGSDYTETLFNRHKNLHCTVHIENLQNDKVPTRFCENFKTYYDINTRTLWHLVIYKKNF